MGRPGQSFAVCPFFWSRKRMGFRDRISIPGGSGNRFYSTIFILPRNGFACALPRISKVHSKVKRLISRVRNTLLRAMPGGSARRVVDFRFYSTIIILPRNVVSVQKLASGGVRKESKKVSEKASRIRGSHTESGLRRCPKMTIK